MALSTERKTEIVGGFKRGTNDTGSPEVQIALLSARINDLGEHFSTHGLGLPMAHEYRPAGGTAHKPRSQHHSQVGADWLAIVAATL